MKKSTIDLLLTGYYHAVEKETGFSVILYVTEKKLFICEIRRKKFPKFIEVKERITINS